MKKGTLEDISKLTGFSITSISRVLNGKAKDFRISEDTESKIMEVAKRIGYKSTPVVQNLRKNKYKTIGLIVPHVDNPFFANLTNAILSEAQKLNYVVISMDSMEDYELENKAIDSLMSMNVEGIIAVPCGKSATKFNKINKLIPLVLVDRYFENTSISYVSTNNHDGAQQAVKLLIDSGHRNIMCIQGVNESITSKERLRGCMDALKGHEKDVHLYISGNDFSIRNGYVETKLMLNRRSDITAIFAFSTTILLGTMEALKDQKLSVPDDVSLVSFDDNTFLDYLNPPITRVAQPTTNLGLVAMKLLMQKINSNVTHNSSLLLRPNLVIRESVKTILGNGK